MTAVYKWDVFSTFDGYGSFVEGADWGGYWSKQGPELLEHRDALVDTEQRMVFGATTFRENAEIMLSGLDPNTLDEWNVRTMRMPATVLSSTLRDTLGWPDATIVSGRSSLSSPDGPGPAQSSEARATSTSSCSKAGRSTATPRRSSTAPPSGDGVLSLRAVGEPDRPA